MKSLTKTSFNVVDTETTGLDYVHDQIVEVGLVKTTAEASSKVFSTIVNPLIPIKPEASAVNHLTDSMVADSDPLHVHVPQITEFVGSDCVVAHRSEFDLNFLHFLKNKDWICSMRLAKHLWPEAPKYGNQFLRYWLELDIELPGPPHRALPDAITTAALFRREIEEYLKQGGVDCLPALIEYVEGPITVTTMPFGKHFGKALADIPHQYLKWAINSIGDMDPDLRASIEKILYESQLPF